MARIALKHSIKVPRLYKSVARIYVDVNKGGNLKALIQELNHPNKRGIMALVVKTLQYSDVLNKLFESTLILQKEPSLNRDLAAVLVTELLWGKRCLQGDSKPIKTVLKYQEELFTAFNTGSYDVKDVIETVWRPRYVRVNTLKSSPQAVINFFTKRAWRKLEIPDEYPEYLKHIKSNLKDDRFVQDFHLKDILLFPYGTVFAKNKLFQNSTILLQDKSSCMATHILSPEPDSTVLDMCAAPGMKTSHLAAYMKNQGKIFAVERDKKRFETLLKTISQSNVKCVKPIRADVLSLELLMRRNVNPAIIDYILLDPSCSGTGMLSRMAFEKPENNAKRLKKLSSLQSKLLRHALTNFPAVKRVVYSTCSVFPEENEMVVNQALSYAQDFKLMDCRNIFKQWFNFGSSEYSCGEKCIKSIPEVDCMNGFFIAAFERIFK